MRGNELIKMKRKMERKFTIQKKEIPNSPLREM
jgi:hypothetical protein